MKTALRKMKKNYFSSSFICFNNILLAKKLYSPQKSTTSHNQKKSQKAIVNLVTMQTLSKKIKVIIQLLIVIHIR